ncbi:unnamed protein product [Pieris brassicae]|uniref:Uncharacterized protein n=1 Tax=Pieris brassicae TaxID=7116 RepID=A0A9P0TUW3_PIEBR|nr:unnamed protein product [Pieris brassicae]
MTQRTSSGMFFHGADLQENGVKRERYQLNAKDPLFPDSSKDQNVRFWMARRTKMYDSGRLEGPKCTVPGSTGCFK